MSDKTIYDLALKNAYGKAIRENHYQNLFEKVEALTNTAVDEMANIQPDDSLHGFHMAMNSVLMKGMLTTITTLNDTLDQVGRLRIEVKELRAELEKE